MADNEEAKRPEGEESGAGSPETAAAAAAGTGGVADQGADEEGFVEVVEGDEADYAADDDEDENEFGAGGSMQPPLDVEIDMSIRTYTGHADSVYCVAAHPSKPMAVSGDGDDKFAVWNIDTCEGKVVSGAHSDTVIAVGFSPDGKHFYTAGYDGVIKVWSSKSLKRTVALEGPTEGVEAVAWHPSRPWLAAAASDGTTWVWNVTSGDAMDVKASGVPFTCLAWAGTEQQLLVAGAEDGSIAVTAPEQAAEVHRFGGADWTSEPCCALATSPDGKLALAGFADGCARLLSLDGNRCLATYNLAAGGVVGGAAADAAEALDEAVSVEGVAFCGSLPLYAVGATNGRVEIYQQGNMRPRHVLNLEESVVTMRWRPDRPLLMVATASAAVHCIDGRSGEQLYALTGHDNMILSMCFYRHAAKTKEPRRGQAAAGAAASAGGQAGDDEADGAEADEEEEEVPLRRGELYMLTTSDDRTCRVFDLPEPGSEAMQALQAAQRAAAQAQAAGAIAEEPAE